MLGVDVLEVRNLGVFDWEMVRGWMKYGEGS